MSSALIHQVAVGLAEQVKKEIGPPQFDVDGKKTLLKVGGWLIRRDRKNWRVVYLENDQFQKMDLDQAAARDLVATLGKELAEGDQVDQLLFRLMEDGIGRVRCGQPPGSFDSELLQQTMLAGADSADLKRVMERVTEYAKETAPVEQP